MLYYLQEGTNSPIFSGTRDECMKAQRYHSECRIVSEDKLYIEED